MIKKEYSQKDFNADLLPLTRKKQLKEIFKNDFKKIGLIALLILAFSIPLIVCHSLLSALAPTITVTLYNAGKTEDEIIKTLSLYNFIFEGASIIGYLILSIGVAGSIRVLRNIVFAEGVLFKDDFLKGIKMYFKIFVLYFLIFGFIKFGLAGMNLISIFINATYIKIINAFFTVTFYILLVPVGLICMSYSIYYQNKFKDVFANSIKIFVANFIKFLPFIVFPIAFYYLVPLISDFSFRILAEILIFLILVPLFILFFHLVCLSIFDKAINEKNYPEIYRKGLSNIKNEEPKDIENNK